MHNFELSDEHTMVLESIGKLVEEVAAKVALERDEHRQFVRESVDEISELGLFGMSVSEASGGAGLGHLALVVAVESCARACGSSARLLLTQAGMCALALDGLDTGAETLEGILTGETLGAFVGIDESIVASGGGAAVTLDGHAGLVTGAGEATTLLVAARSGDTPVLAVAPAGAAAITPVAALGFRATAPASVAFAGTAAEVLARGDEAARAIERAKLAAWIGGAALAVGLADGAIEHTRRHAAERHAFGKPLLGQQAVARKLVECRRRSEAARHLVFHAARLADAGADARETAMLAKITAIDAAVHAADEAIQIHGGYGFTVEYHVERHYRDAKTLEVLDGGLDELCDALAPTA